MDRPEPILDTPLELSEHNVVKLKYISKILNDTSAGEIIYARSLPAKQPLFDIFVKITDNNQFRIQVMIRYWNIDGWNIKDRVNEWEDINIEYLLLNYDIDENNKYDEDFYIDHLGKRIFRTIIYSSSFLKWTNIMSGLIPLDRSKQFDYYQKDTISYICYKEFGDCWRIDPDKKIL